MFFISPGSVIGHHSIIIDHCFVATHAVVLGSATIEPYCFLGANSTILQKVNVASEYIIGAGVTIAKNTKERAVYVDKTCPNTAKAQQCIKCMAYMAFKVKQNKTYCARSTIRKLTAKHIVILV